MDLQADINWIKSRIDGINDPAHIQVLKSIVSSFSKEGSNEAWEEITSDEIAAIDEGIQQADSGETVTHAEMKNRFKKWL
ncbi:MAG: hypothetical protein ACFB10_07560 [Salibacteraceae bacterium]